MQQPCPAALCSSVHVHSYPAAVGAADGDAAGATAGGAAAAILFRAGYCCFSFQDLGLVAVASAASLPHMSDSQKHIAVPSETIADVRLATSTAVTAAVADQSNHCTESVVAAVLKNTDVSACEV